MLIDAVQDHVQIGAGDPGSLLFVILQHPDRVIENGIAVHLHAPQVRQVLQLEHADGSVQKAKMDRQGISGQVQNLPGQLLDLFLVFRHNKSPFFQPENQNLLCI